MDTAAALLGQARLTPLWSTLAALEGFAGSDGLSGREVAEIAGVSPTTGIKYLHDLEAAGAAARYRFGRADRWTLTEVGKAFLETWPERAR